MLHKRSLPQAEVADLWIAYLEKLNLLNWLLRTPPTNPLMKADFENRFGKIKGEWFWSSIRQPSKRTAFGRAVDALATKAFGNKQDAILVANAILNDALFHERWGEAGYGLEFSRLFPGWLDVVKGVAEPFYDLWLTGSGFEKADFGLQGEDMTRDRIMKAFRPQSMGICGFCDGPLGEVGTTKEANDCDHFFPKSIWPHLAIHPANLFASCKGCNETWKLAAVPMGNADAAGLAETYHPQLRAGATHIHVTATRSPSSHRQVKISIRDTAFPRRAVMLVKTLDLEARWANDVNEKMDGRGVSVFIAKAVRDSRRNQALTRADLEEIINSDIDWYRQERGKVERSFRLEAALQYQKANHLPDILAEL